MRKLILVMSMAFKVLYAEDSQLNADAAPSTLTNKTSQNVSSNASQLYEDDIISAPRPSHPNTVVDSKLTQNEVLPLAQIYGSPPAMQREGAFIFYPDQQQHNNSQLWLQNGVQNEDDGYDTDFRDSSIILSQFQHRVLPQANGEIGTIGNPINADAAEGTRDNPVYVD